MPAVPSSVFRHLGQATKKHRWTRPTTESDPRKLNKRQINSAIPSGFKRPSPMRNRARQNQPQAKSANGTRTSTTARPRPMIWPWCANQRVHSVCPEGTGENGPAFQRGVQCPNRFRPEGTAEILEPNIQSSQPSLRDLKPAAIRPGVETPGYFHDVPSGQTHRTAAYAQFVPRSRNPVFPQNDIPNPAVTNGPKSALM